MSFYKEDGKYVYLNTDLDYDHEDETIEIRRSNLRRARNAHLLIGCGFGVGLTLATQYLFFWTIGVF